MHDIYQFVSGPLLMLSFAVFICGLIYRLVSLAVLAWKKDFMVYSYMSLRYSIRSIIHWIIPFAATNMKKHPVMTVVTFLFHISILAVPLFLFAHGILWYEAWGVNLWHIPNVAADVMTIIVVASCLFFLCRRLFLPEVNYVTDAKDYLLLAIVAAPFITGFWAYHQFPGYTAAMLLHIISGELWLVVIPFSKISHMVFFWFTRAYMGSEFGAIKHARDW